MFVILLDVDDNELRVVRDESVEYEGLFDDVVEGFFVQLSGRMVRFDLPPGVEKYSDLQKFNTLCAAWDAMSDDCCSSLYS